MLWGHLYSKLIPGGYAPLIKLLMHDFFQIECDRNYIHLFFWLELSQINDLLIRLWKFSKITNKNGACVFMEVVKSMVFAHNKYSMIFTNQVRVSPSILEMLEKINFQIARKNWYSIQKCCQIVISLHWAMRFLCITSNFFQMIDYT